MTTLLDTSCSRSLGSGPVRWGFQGDSRDRGYPDRCFDCAPAPVPLLWLSALSCVARCRFAVEKCPPHESDPLRLSCAVMSARPTPPPRTASAFSGASVPLSRGTTLGSASSDVERKKRSHNLLRDYYGAPGAEDMNTLDIGPSCSLACSFRADGQTCPRRSTRACTLRR